MREEEQSRQGLFIVAELSSGSGFARRRVRTFTAPAWRPAGLQSACLCLPSYSFSARTS